MAKSLEENVKDILGAQVMEIALLRTQLGQLQELVDTMLSEKRAAIDTPGSDSPRPI